MANFIGESNTIQVRIVDRDKVVTPWGELVCNTKGREQGETFLFFRPHQVQVEQNGFYEGVIVKREFIGGRYRYHIGISKGEVKLYDQELYRIGESIRFSIKEMKLLFS